MESELPILSVLPEIRRLLKDSTELVLQAPPGAGKTTRVPLALLDEPWLAGQKILMLQPRRVAARSCAAHMADLLGEAVGEQVGYRVRLDSKIGPSTRIEVVTEGILTRMLQSDPSLEGVGLLIFDEFHERSLDADLGLALALQGREIFRDTANSLRLLVMSATLDGDAVAGLLGNAPLVTCEGRQYPVQVHYGNSRRPTESIIEPCIALLQKLAIDSDSGSVLVFLPGQGEIRRVVSGLSLGDDFEVCPLYGGLSLSEQQRAISPSAEGRRKIVLATNIAETSLTIEGIHTVVDSGLARVPLYDPANGMTRLHTRRISRASSVQRMGRAGRLGPGRCYRLWSEEQQQQLAPQGEPEILQADLAPLVLQLLDWGITEPGELSWLDRPPQGAWQQGLLLLQSLGAIVCTKGDEADWQMTEMGREMLTVPVHPRLAAMMLFARSSGELELACQLAAMFSERDPIQAGDVNLARRMDLLTGKASPSQRGWQQRVKQQAGQYQRLLQSSTDAKVTNKGSVGIGVLLACAWPDRIGRKVNEVDSQQQLYQLSNGRRASLSANDGLTREDYIVAADVGGRAGQSEDRIYLAAALDERVFSQALAHRVQEKQILAWDERQDRLLAERQCCVGELILSSEKIQDYDRDLAAAEVAAMVQRRGLQVLPWTDELRQWRARVCLVQSLEGGDWPDLSDPWLLHNIEQWLQPYLGAVTTANKLKSLNLPEILAALLPWPLPRELDKLAPERLQVPSGSSIRLDYNQVPPVLAVKLQEMFQCEETPRLVNGKQPVLVQLLSPAGRAIQLTQDLAGFWRSSYQEVKKEMKGRYPKHPWPDDPLAAIATRHTKKRQQRDPS